MKETETLEEAITRIINKSLQSKDYDDEINDEINMIRPYIEGITSEEKKLNLVLLIKTIEMRLYTDNEDEIDKRIDEQVENTFLKIEGKERIWKCKYQSTQSLMDIVLPRFDGLKDNSFTTLIVNASEKLLPYEKYDMIEYTARNSYMGFTKLDEELSFAIWLLCDSVKTIPIGKKHIRKKKNNQKMSPSPISGN